MEAIRWRCQQGETVERKTGIGLATMVRQPAGASAERHALDAAIESIERNSSRAAGRNCTTGSAAK